MIGTLAFVLVSVKNKILHKYLKDCTCIKCLVDDLEDICDETVAISETTSINSTKKVNCWLLIVL